MTSSVFAVLFGLNFVLFPCEGQVSPPSGGDTFVVLPGEDVTITWKLDVGVSSIDYRLWTFRPKGSFAQITADGEVVETTQYSPGPFTITKPSTLILENVNIQYNGTYSFLVVSGVQFTASLVHVFVAVKPNITTITLTPEKAVVGRSIAILCESSGLPEPSYTIKHNDTVVSIEKTFTISEVKWSDAGLYQCIAENKLGCNSKFYCLTVVENDSDEIDSVATTAATPNLHQLPSTVVEAAVTPSLTKTSQISVAKERCLDMQNKQYQAEMGLLDIKKKNLLNEHKRKMEVLDAEFEYWNTMKNANENHTGRTTETKRTC